MKKKYIILLPIILIISVFVLICYKNNESKIINKSKQPNEDKQVESYDNCVKKLINSEDIKKRQEQLDTYFSNNYFYSSILYYNLNDELKYSIKDSEIYYGASLIKTLEALYIYEKALDDESILDDTVKYTSNYVASYSDGMKKHEIGEEISIRKLVEYAISVSDNSAHFMLVDYIGFNNLKEYGNSIGNTQTLVGGDKYGNIILNDAFNYMLKLNEFIEKNPKLGNELKEYFNNNYYNNLLFDNTQILHKYGLHKSFYHDIGIVEDKKPYIVIVLTNYGYENYEDITKKISKKINEFHKYYEQQKEILCSASK